MELETARLRLRPFTPADGDGLFAILGDRETMAYSFPMIRGESDRFLEQSLLRRDPPVGYALEAEGVPGLAGYVLFCPLEDPGTYELGWFLRRDLWGRGYAGEISRTLLDYAFDVLGLRQVVGETIDLRRAGRLLGQLGMAKLGETQVTDCRGRPALPVRRHRRAVAGAEEAAGLFRRGKPPGLGPLSDLPAPGGGVGAAPARRMGGADPRHPGLSGPDPSGL